MERINKWVIDKYLINDRFQSKLKESLDNAGFEVFQAEYLPVLNESFYLPDAFQNEPVGIYGSFEFVREYTKRYSNIMAFGNSDNFKCSHYLSYVDNDWFINADHVFSTFSIFENKIEAFFDRLGSDRLFIRPDTGFKAFTGFVVSRNDYKDQLSAIKQLTKPSPELMVLVSVAQTIHSEYRFVIANQQVKTASSYIINGDINYDEQPPDEVSDYVQSFVSGLDWAPDSCFICDAALTDNGPEIMEFNAFSHSDLYTCDAAKAFDAASRVLYEELNQDCC